ncbi:unnamed protein product [Peniophora sp. CBMAI 1063]|nr:unnamed protein product [Peniophora sp. CBMAI 1063]
MLEVCTFFTLHFDVLTVFVASYHQDQLKDLELLLCDARIVVELAAANNEPLTAQELAALQVKCVELQIKQEAARASNQLQHSDITLQDLELALLTQRIKCATLALNGANDADRRLADLRVKRSALLLSQCKKHAQHPSTSDTLRSASTAAITSLSDPVTRPVHTPSWDPALVPNASFELTPGLSRASLSRDSSPHTSSTGSVLLAPGVLTDKPVIPHGSPNPTVAIDDRNEDEHTGGVERELIGEDVRQPTSIVHEAPKLCKDLTAIIDIDDAGVARALTPPHARSHGNTPDVLLQADCGDDASALGDDDAPFMFVGSPHAPRTVLEAHANKSGLPQKTPPKAHTNKSSLPLKALINACKSDSPQKTPPKLNAKPHTAVGAGQPGQPILVH